MRTVFLHISKAFDRVWHWGLIAKLRSIGVEGEFVELVYQLPFLS